MFDAWGELIEASIVTKHIILIHESNTKRLLVRERRNKKERNSRRRRRRRKENSFLRHLASKITRRNCKEKPENIN